jgi:hypothetical protein
MELTAEIIMLLQDAADKLKGCDRRTFMAKVVSALGWGGQRRAECALGWDRGTIRKGTHELASGFACLDAFSLRGRRKAETRLPHLLEDIRSLVDSQSQIDPTFQTQRLYTRLSAAEVRQQLIEQKQYAANQLPTIQTFNTKLNQLGYTLRTVAKTQPLKKLPETDLIFAQLHLIHQRSAHAERSLRVSLDAKATVKIGLFSRGGRSRQAVAAWDHDFKPEVTLTPFGLLLPHSQELFLYLTTSKVTSDFIVDTLQDWWQRVSTRFPFVQTLQLDLDNGPETHSRRTQFVYRLIQFAQTTGLTLELAYYPPYHSKYNPIERCWAGLENHWNGTLLDSVETVVRFAQSLKWCGNHPFVRLVTQAYATGVKLTKQAMSACEERIDRLPSLRKWFVTICPTTT